MGSINSSVCSNEDNIKYLKSQCDHLNDHEKKITLKFDKIQIKSKLEYREGKITGTSEDRENELAHHIQAFMIKSVSSDYSKNGKTYSCNKK